jgi:hypothetical protein
MNRKRWGLFLWAAFILLFAVLHFVHLGADFPNYSRWMDWSKYTDEGWYGNAAIQYHLNGAWFVSGDFNTAVALPVWPLLEWSLFFFTGVSVVAARALVVSLFIVNLGLSYSLLRSQHTRWVALLGVTLLATSSYLYCFSRLAILEPLLICLALAALNLAVRIPQLSKPVLASAAIGVLFVLMVLTKTTAVFLAPALVWAFWYPQRREFKIFLRRAVIAAGTAVLLWGFYFLVLVRPHYLRDYSYLFEANVYQKPATLFGVVAAYYYSFHGGLWCDRILIPLAGILVLLSLVAARSLWRNPVFVASLLAVGGYLFFIGYHNNMQPRYYEIVAFFAFFLVVQGVAGLLQNRKPLAYAALLPVLLAVVWNANETISFIRHPEYTFISAAHRMTRYIDEHPNGNRLLLSISGNEVQLISHIPSICDDFGTLDLPSRIQKFKPGWYAAWNDLDPGTLEDLHTQYSLEQVAIFPAFDDEERNKLVLFKLHPLPASFKPEPGDRSLTRPLPWDHFSVPIE